MLKEISIEIIRRCPNNCVHCSSVSDENCTEILDYDRFIAIVQDAARLGAKTICLSGGEPFLHNRISDMIKFVDSLGLQTYVYTSGIVFDGENQKTPLEKTVLKGISAYVTKLIFNIEAANSSTYDEIMGTDDCFEKMKQSIRDANSYAILTEAHFVPMKLNINEIDAVVSLCKELNVSKLSFLRLVLHGRAQKNEVRIALSDDDLQELKVKLQTIKEQAETDIRIGVPLSADSSCHKCEAANGKLNIKYDGKVFPCEVFKNERISQGFNGTQPESVYNKSLFDIYKTSSYLSHVRALSQEFSCGKHCETCVGQYLIEEEGCCNEQ